MLVTSREKAYSMKVKDTASEGSTSADGAATTETRFSDDTEPPTPVS
jgi:hypothetical protein